MHGGVFLMALAAGACSHGAPARAEGIECRSIAAARAMTGVSESEACALVRDRVATALGAARHGAVTIALDLSRSGSAIARVSETRGGVVHAYPEIAVDVMDRPLGRGDLIRLGDAIAGALAAAAVRGD